MLPENDVPKKTGQGIDPSKSYKADFNVKMDLIKKN